MQPTLVLVGGFLGAGKTTWLLAAGARLRESGKRVGIVLNDQGGELVDAHTARASGFDSEEVTGGCFCCRLSDFVRAAKRLPCPDVILAEPVGSCTDLAATVIRPLGREFRIAPSTVLVDPERAEELKADPLLAYVFKHQVAEADIVLLAKADLGREAVDGIRGRAVSAVTGEGLDEWLEAVLKGEAGGRTVDIDYALYAEAEAALAWLDWNVAIKLKRPLTPAALIGPLMADLDSALTSAGARIAHLKSFIRSGGGYLKASICRNGDEPIVNGALDAPPSLRHDIVLNLRAAAAASVLDAALDGAAARIPGAVRVLTRACFHPGPPVPEQRIVEGS